MAMFDRLHPKMRRIGEVELVQPSIELYMQVALVPGKNVFTFRQEVVNYFLHQMLRMPEAKMSNEEHAEIGQEKV